MSKKSAKKDTKKLTFYVTRDQYDWMVAYEIADIGLFFRTILDSYIKAYGEAERQLQEPSRIVLDG
jgi:hypothetical protein